MLTMTELKKKGRLRIALSTQGKVLLALAVVVLLGLIGYGWYVYRGNAAEKDLPQAGINTALPDAVVKEKDPVDKMAYYDQAKKDSARRDTGGLVSAASKLGFGGKPEDEQTRRINEKLSAINQALGAAPAAGAGVGIGGGLPVGSYQPKYSSGAGIGNKEVDKLESLMKNMSSAKDRDPEMEQLGSMMDKLLALQNPALAGALLKPAVGDALVPDSLFKAVPAEVTVSQRIKQGSVVELRLLDTLVVSGQFIFPGQLVYGLASFTNQRLNLEIKNIRLGTSIVPVNLTVFDRRDGMAGINAPEALVRDAVTGGISSASGSIGITGFDLGTQLAGAGIDAARSLLNKKMSRLRQRLVAGYPLLLRDNSRKLK